MNSNEIKDFLDYKAAEYEQPSFLEYDPIQIPHLFNKKEDIADADAKLKAIVKSLPEANATTHVINGSIFTDIGKFAEEQNAVAIIKK